MAEETIKPNATVYVCFTKPDTDRVLTRSFQARNLNDKIKLPTLIESLREIFSEVGKVVEVVAKKNLKAKGQAFIVFDSIESAQSAIEDLQGFEIFEKPIQLAFAKTRSDATVQREDGEEALEAHKRHRIAEKERKQAVEAAQNSLKRSAADADNTLTERPAKAKVPPGGPAGVIPDEYLPPNKTLVLRELPADYTQDQLTIIFGRYPGFREVRMVPGRSGIAFAEYENENGAIAGKEAMNGVTLGEKTIRVTFQRQ